MLNKERQHLKIKVIGYMTKKQKLNKNKKPIEMITYIDIADTFSFL